VLIVQQVSGLLARDERDGELAGETAFGGPFQEVADEVAGVRAAGFQPSRLRERTALDPQLKR
jgi:hypothetical protein